MTEKRYVIEEIGNMFRVLKDNEPLTTKFENCDKQDVTNLITELNELAEERDYFERKKEYFLSKWSIAHTENIQLRQENEELKSKYSEQCIQLDFLKDENQHMRKVINENEQLKHFIQELTTKGTGKIHLANGNIYKVDAILIDLKV